jgi:hypothetical protein
MMLSMIVGRVGKNLFLPAVSGIHCRADAGFAIQLIAADLRKRQITKNQEKENENHYLMQVPSSC